jgi:uncharacterized membrane protein
MLVAGVATLVAGLVLVWPRFQVATGTDKAIVLGPVFEAVALAIFAAEHFTAARDMMGIVPKWLPGPLFWTYFVGVAWLAAAISFVIWRNVRWSALLTGVLLLLIVITIDLPDLPKGPHTRFFWILTVRETCFASGVMVLAGSLWRGSFGNVLVRVGRFVVGATMVFYAIEHFLYPRNVAGVPLEKMTPEWIPGAVVIADFVGLVLLVAGIAILVGWRTQAAAASAGMVLVLLTAFFYGPIFLTEMHTKLAVEGMNYIGDTLMFGATVLLVGWGAEPRNWETSSTS